MRPADWLRGHALAAAAVAGTGLGLVAGLLWPLPTVPVQAGGEMQLAVPPRSALDRYAEADFARLRGSTLWSGSAPAQAGAATMRSWRLLGVVLRPQGAALVQVDNRQISVALGEQLPGGAQLVAVRADSVEFLQGQCSYRRSLYATVDQPLPSDGCPAAPDNAAPRAAGN